MGLFSANGLGEVCVNVNGERGSYFRTYQGLRQGDPLSPLLFNIVADVLSSLLDKAIKKGHVTGILPEFDTGAGGFHTCSTWMIW
jgi:hypothetical protein